MGWLEIRRRGGLLLTTLSIVALATASCSNQPEVVATTPPLPSSTPAVTVNPVFPTSGPPALPPTIWPVSSPTPIPPTETAIPIVTAEVVKTNHNFSCPSSRDCVQEGDIRVGDTLTLTGRTFGDFVEIRQATAQDVGPQTSWVWRGAVELPAGFIATELTADEVPPAIVFQQDNQSYNNQSTNFKAVDLVADKIKSGSVYTVDAQITITNEGAGGSTGIYVDNGLTGSNLRRVYVVYEGGQWVVVRNNPNSDRNEYLWFSGAHDLNAHANVQISADGKSALVSVGSRVKSVALSSDGSFSLYNGVIPLDVNLQLAPGASVKVTNFSVEKPPDGKYKEVPPSPPPAPTRTPGAEPTPRATEVTPSGQVVRLVDNDLDPGHSQTNMYMYINGEYRQQGFAWSGWSVQRTGRTATGIDGNGNRVAIVQVWVANDAQGTSFTYDDIHLAWFEADCVP